MADQTQVAAQFKAIYVRALTDTENGRDKSRAQKDNDYAQVSHFINDLTRAKDIQSLDTCIAAYLQIYYRHSPEDRRSKMAIFHLLSSRIDLTQPGDNYLRKLSDELHSTQRPFTPLRQRFETLESNDKGQLFQLLQYKDKLARQYATILDDLKQAYSDEHNGAKPSTAQLYTFNPVPDATLRNQFQNLTSQCAAAWNVCTKEFSDRSWAAFELTLNSFRNFLRQYESDKLKLFQILAWCRAPYLGTTETQKIGGQYVERTYRVATGYLDDEFYFQTVYALYLRAVRIVNPAVYQRGFSAQEETFFLEPLARKFYFENYRNRLKMGFSKASEFDGVAKAFLWLLLFAQSRNLSLVRDQKLIEIAKIYDQAIKESGKAPQPPGKAKAFSTRGKQTWDYAKGEFKVGDKLGAGSSETEIVYFEGEESRRNLRIYLEYTRMRGPLFEVNLDGFLSRVEATPRLVVWENNKGLIRLIAEYFAFLFTMFFPGIGYFGVFLEEGFVGVLRQYVEQEVLNRIVDSISNYGGATGPGGAGGPGIGSWLGIILSPKRGATKLAREAEKEMLKEADAEVGRLEERLANRQLGRGIADSGTGTGRRGLPSGAEMRGDSTKSIVDDVERGIVDPKAKRPTTPKTTRVDWYEKKVDAPFKERPEVAEARRKLTDDMKRRLRLPKGSTASTVSIERTEAGRAQVRVITPEGSTTAMDVELKIKLPDGRTFKPDGVELFKTGHYMFQEHREVLTIWEKSHYSRAVARRDLEILLQERAGIYRTLKPYGCAGFQFTTNDENLATLIAELITSMRAAGVEGLYPPPL